MSEDSLKEQIDEWQRLSACKAWGWLCGMLHDQMQVRIQMILAPTPEGGSEKEQFMKGEVDAMVNFQNMPQLAIENLKIDIEQNEGADNV
jgi:hypothetical protein